ncbi:MAG: histidine phosphatase family protein [Emcibacteraceae bacterium]|nr:histidine phosphatase family protein [Emcibacteraceae bacterium]
MKKIFLSILAICCLLVPALAQAESTYYVVRHAEKMAGDDPLLTSKGLRRAAHISGMLADVSIDGVYSTQTNRTLMTATVTAASKGVTVEIFSTDDLGAFAAMLKKREGTFLIVAHSSSTPDIAALLSREEIPKLDEDDFEKLFKVVITDGVAELEVLTTTFE